MRLREKLDTALFGAELLVKMTLERDPFHRSRPANGWVLTRYADIQTVLGDRTFSSDELHQRRYPRMRAREARAGIPDPYDQERASMLRLDPPDHTRLRNLVNKAFTPRAVERMRPRIESYVEELLAPLEGRQTMELIREFAVPLPVSVIAEMLGVPVEDRELRGHRLSRGQQLVLVLAAGNRDPERFADPDRLDVTRDDVRHLSFSYGLHHCLGAQLARLEGAVALEALVTRFPDLRFDGPIEWGDNTVLRGPRSLPLAF